MKKKKGFTLIEIIIVIALLSVIGVGSTVVILKVRDKHEVDTLVENQDKFQNALDIYLSNHEEVVNNIKNNANGAVISLEVLKNEGLIPGDLKINYKDNYYTVTHALLTNEKLEDIDFKHNCSKTDLTSIASWVTSADAFENTKVYFCPKEDSGCNQSPDCSSCDFIKDPKVACENKILNENALACKVIKKANDTIKSSVCTYNNKFVNTCFDTSHHSPNNSSALIDKDRFEEYVDAFARLKYGLLYYEKPSVDEYNYVKELLNENTDVYQKDSTDTVDTSLSKDDLARTKFCKSYTFDDLTGKYKLIDNVTDPDDCYEYYINYYNGTSDSIYSVNEKLFQDGYKYYLSGDELRIVVGANSEGTKCIDAGYGAGIRCYFKSNGYKGVKFEEKSLRIIDDEYGTSYYYRGNVKDNYVTFNEDNGELWRIVRVQGDGSVKLIKDEKINLGTTWDKVIYGTVQHVPVTSITNTSAITGTYEYPGLLDYDNGKMCWDFHYSVDIDYINKHQTKNNGYYTIKDILNNYISTFDENILEKLKSEEVCLGSPDDKIYFDYTNSESKRFDNISLKCDDKRKSYSTYVAPITVDEAMLAGAKSSSYLRKNSDNSSYYTISLASQTKYLGKVFIINDSNKSDGITTMDAGGACPNHIAKDDSIHPIETINLIPTIILKTGVKVKDGNGTKEKPYVIDLN